MSCILFCTTEHSVKLCIILKCVADYYYKLLTFLSIIAVVFLFDCYILK